MTSKEASKICLYTLSIAIFYLCSSCLLLSEDQRQAGDCLDQAVTKIAEIRSLPLKKRLHTLDGKHVLLSEFYAKCDYLFPQCILFRKFYYWRNEIREVVSVSENGHVTHKIRYYCNCFSEFCTQRGDPRKTHGDVAEFYDGTGEFMGLAIYMGNGNYCSLPYDGYHKNRPPQNR